jgi:hypothetical protein
VWGANLFKLAPVLLAAAVCDAVVEEGLPGDLLAVGHPR